MPSQQGNGFERINFALAEYYRNLGYRDHSNLDTGNGIFLQYAIAEELCDEEELPINKELGDDCDPNDCAYSWMHTEFPIPDYVKINNNQQKDAFIFYVLQCCYKYGQAPSERCMCHHTFFFLSKPSY